MGVLDGDDFVSDYDGDRVDFLLGQVETLAPGINASNIQGFISACQTARAGAETARTGAENALSSANAAAVNANGYKNQAAASATEAQNAASQTVEQVRNELQEYVTASESWAKGGTNSRAGENTNNSKYYCERAEAAAEQASVPPVEGVYNIILADRVTSAKYALVVYNGRLTAVGVASSTEATEMTLVDGATGKNYTLVASNGRICLEEV